MKTRAVSSVLATAIGIIVFASTSAHAQFRVAPLLDRGPLRFSAGVDVQLNKFGQNVVGTATTFAAVRGVQNVIDALIPELNRRLACGKGRKYGATISQITPIPNSMSNQGAPLVFQVNAHVAGCSLGLVQGDVGVSVPVGLAIRNRTVELRVAQVQVQSQGVFVVGLFQIPDAAVADAGRQISPQIGQAVAVINRWINSRLAAPATQKQINAYKLQIQSARIDLQGGDLIVTLGLTGQVPLAKADSLLNF